jgi:hypothetical protein
MYVHFMITLDKNNISAILVSVRSLLMRLSVIQKHYYFMRDVIFKDSNPHLTRLMDYCNIVRVKLLVYCNKINSITF